jgi:transcription initiation factor TFIID TATA-box-binding protein
MRKRKYSTLSKEESPFQCDANAPIPTVHNIVATSQISGSIGTLDLNLIHEMLPFSFYDQHKFAAITVRLHQPDCTTLLFSSGKLVVTGCRTWYECVYASLFIAKLLDECLPGQTFQLTACDVQNMVAHAEIPVQGGSLDLQAMYAQLALNCTYQRKMFPGLIYRPKSSPVVLLCFFSGKIVITGGKTMDDVFSGWSRLWPTLQRFIVPQPHVSESAQHRKVQEGLALVRHAAANDARRGAESLVEDAGGGGSGDDAIDLADGGELQGLCHYLAAEGPPPVQGRGVAVSAGEGRGEPGAPHGGIVEDQGVGASGATEFQTGLVLLDGDGQTNEFIHRIAEIFGPEAGGLTPDDGETLVKALEKELDVAKWMGTHLAGQSVNPVVCCGGT